jgi:DGQHR domain-containing protein
MPTEMRRLRLSALRIEQRRDAPLFIFGVNGRIIHQFASVNFAERSRDGVLTGYQRDRVQSHIAQILAYLRQDDALLPNAIVIAFNGEVTFTPVPGAMRSEWGTLGHLEVPLPRSGQPKPGFIVDGQQRVSALAQLDPTRDFPVVVVSFTSHSDALQREQFVLVNKTKPLPRDLLNELLPHVETQLPKPWRLKRVAGRVLELLRFDKQSPFYGRIRGVGGYGEGCSISQAAVLGVIEASIRRGGVLSEFYFTGSDSADTEAMARVVRVFFKGVERVWPYAWNGNPWNSRLVHGVGISAIGGLMDVIMEEVDSESPRAVSSVARRLKKIERVCAWTEGRWRGLDCAWDQLQNTSQDKRRLAQYLVSAYQRRA